LYACFVFFWFSLVSPSKCQDSTLNWAMIVSLHILSLEHRHELDAYGSKYKLVVSSCDHGNVPFASIKGVAEWLLAIQELWSMGLVSKYMKFDYISKEF
jgi:hypothetical protein